MTQTINEVKGILAEIKSIEELDQHDLNKDTRKGVQLNIERRRKQLLKEKEIIAHYNVMKQYENELLSANSKALICGIDEVGRGPLAGPVVACAVILNEGHQYLTLLLQLEVEIHRFESN